MPRATVLSEQELSSALEELPGWAVDHDTLVKAAEAADFTTAIEWVVAIAEIAEQMDHHPDIDIRYRTVIWRLSTHSVGGITDLDIRLAREIDQLVGG
jgi:4a-hydroxytetrahydrobiopterin dehydratase